MNKIIVSLLFMFFISSAVAQEFNGGIYGSAALSQIDGDTFKGYNKFGFSGGVYVNRFINKKLAPQLGLRYIQKGSREVNDAVDYKCVLQYIEMPITLRYFHWEKFDGEAGVSLGYLMNEKESMDSYEVLDAPSFNKFELAGILGVNYKITPALSLGIHFSYSLLFVRPHSQNYNTMDKGQHNNVLMFTMAYQLTSWR